jgi:multidrug transporter EmrE-like cation transporter
LVLALVSIAGVVLFREPATWQLAAGIALIVAGVLLVGIPNGSGV